MEFPGEHIDPPIGMVLGKRVLQPDFAQKKNKPTTKPISIWQFNEAPEELQISMGGDEDLVILVPSGQTVPYQLDNLGCCSNYKLFVRHDGELVELVTEGDRTAERFMGIRLPMMYAGCTIVIPTHG